MNKQQQAVLASYENKHQKKQFNAQLRKRGLFPKLPELREIDGQLNTLGVSLIRAVGEAKKPEAFRQAYKALLEKQRDVLEENGYPRDYLDIHYDCPLCEDRGYIKGERCECLSKALVEAGFTGFDLQHYIRAENFDSFRLDFYPDTREANSPQKIMAIYKKKMELYVEDFNRIEENYFFTGRPGVGKTFLSNCIVGALVEQGYSIVYTSAGNLIRTIKDSLFEDGRRESEVYEPLISADLLVIDDFGAEYRTEYNRSTLFEVINARLLARKKMIISSNLGSDEIKNHYDERLASRIIGNFISIQFIGDDNRIKMRRFSQKV